MIKQTQKNVSRKLRMYVIVIFYTRPHFEYILCNSLREKKLLYYAYDLNGLKSVFPKIDDFQSCLLQMPISS